MLRVKLLAEGAKAPTVANAGEDLGFDLYALEDITLLPGVPTKVRTGIAAEFEVRMPVPRRSAITDQVIVDMVRVPYGLLIRDRSSMAANGVTVSGGVVDAGYRGEIAVFLTKTIDAYNVTTDFDEFVHQPDGVSVGVWKQFVKGVDLSLGFKYEIKAGDKIAQMIPMPVLTKNGVEVVEELSQSQRGEGAFGSTGV
jgi:dUTP pyrophosphatase